jgi:outer membrane protein assembly factor BamB
MVRVNKQESSDEKQIFWGIMKMFRLIKNRLSFLSYILIFSVIQSGFAAEIPPQRLVSSELLKHAGLKILWEQQLPIKKAESLERMLILDNRIYVFSNRNYIISLDRENGKWIFGKAFPLGSLPVGGLKLYRDELLSANGNKLTEIDLETGEQRGSMEIGYSIICPAARNSSYFYLSGTDRRLHTLRVNDRVQIFEVSADNDSKITSIIAEEDFVIFGTDRGNVVSIKPDGPTRLWQFDAAGAIAGEIIMDGRSLFFASADSNVYRVDMAGSPDRKFFVWKYQMPGMLEMAPRVTRQFVYQYTRTKGVTALDKGGSFLWHVPGGVDLLAEHNNKAYVITENNKLAVMDNNKAKKLYSVNFKGVTRHAANVMDSKIYIADERGRVACLQPVE